MRSELMGISSQIFIQTTCREPGVITLVQFLEGLPPKIWDGKKTSKIFRDFWQLSTLIANISETDPQIENRKSRLSTTTPPTLDEKRPWTLVPKRKSYWRAYWPTQVDIFRETIFRPLGGGAMPPKFLHALQIGQGYLAHTSTGTGVPPKKF